MQNKASLKKHWKYTTEPGWSQVLQKEKEQNISMGVKFPLALLGQGFLLLISWETDVSEHENNHEQSKDLIHIYWGRTTSAVNQIQHLRKTARMLHQLRGL